MRGSGGSPRPHSRGRGAPDARRQRVDALHDDHARLGHAHLPISHTRARLEVVDGRLAARGRGGRARAGTRAARSRRGRSGRAPGSSAPPSGPRCFAAAARSRSAAGLRGSRAAVSPGRGAAGAHSSAQQARTVKVAVDDAAGVVVVVHRQDGAACALRCQAPGGRHLRQRGGPAARPGSAPGMNARTFSENTVLPLPEGPASPTCGRSERGWGTPPPAQVPRGRRGARAHQHDALVVHREQLQRPDEDVKALRRGRRLSRRAAGSGRHELSPRGRCGPHLVKRQLVLQRLYAEPRVAVALGLHDLKRVLEQGLRRTRARSGAALAAGKPGARDQRGPAAPAALDTAGRRARALTLPATAPLPPLIACRATTVRASLGCADVAMLRPYSRPRRGRTPADAPPSAAPRLRLCRPAAPCVTRAELKPQTSGLHRQPTADTCKAVGRPCQFKAGFFGRAPFPTPIQRAKLQLRPIGAPMVEWHRRQAARVCIAHNEAGAR